MRLDAAQAGDRAAVLALMQQSGLPTEDLSEAHWPHFVVARADDELVGVAGFEPHPGGALLRSFAVSPPWRGHGLGTRLLSAVEGHIRQRGLTGGYLLTTTAAPFFVRHGFTPIERDRVPDDLRASPEFVSLCPASALVLFKDLGG